VQGSVAHERSANGFSIFDREGHGIDQQMSGTNRAFSR
jgi:hypothetical protein